MQEDLKFADLASLIRSKNTLELSTLLHQRPHLHRKRNIRFNECLLHVAAEMNSVVICDLLRSCGSDNNIKDSFGNTVLHIAAFHNSVDVLQWMLRIDRRSIDSQNAVGETPLFVAARKGHERCVDVLLQNDCDRNVTNVYNVTPVEVARLKKEKSLLGRTKKKYLYIASMIGTR